ncbi:MAG: peptidoglycan-binding domain-containing protein [Pseudomonadota bacterium]
MLSKTLISAALAAALALVPASRAVADRGDFIAGAIIGGIGGAIINNEVRKNKARQAARQRAVVPRTYATQPRSYATQPRAYRAPAKKTYRPAIPATPEGREIQSSLNYFGFNAGPIDGQVGSKTRNAIADYQRYMGYDGTGQLTSFQQHILTSAYFRAEAGGNRTFQDIASHPDGTRGLLKIYREDLAAGNTGERPLRPEPSSSTTYTDL